IACSPARALAASRSGPTKSGGERERVSARRGAVARGGTTGGRGAAGGRKRLHVFAWCMWCPISLAYR
ncbi:unnamed protein product, partial [Closterium sp. Naga37s-1]